MMIRNLLIFFFVLLLTGCQNSENGNSSDVDPDRIWFDYKINGEEESEEITVLLQFRFGGSNGTTILLTEPSNVTLDGVLVKGDSSRMTGAFYESIVPVNGFIGKHEIVFTDDNKKKYREEFHFQPMSLVADFPDTIRREELVFELQGLEEGDRVRVLLTDTSFTSPGINRLQIAINGRLELSSSDLQKVVNGPVQLELIKENERRVTDGTEEGGRIAISYGLRRSFVLID